MVSKFSKFLIKQPWARVLKSLVLSNDGLCLREIAEFSDVSVAGVQDVLRRFTESEMVTMSRSGNKKLFSLCLNSKEFSMLESLFLEERREIVARRAEKFSSKKKEAIDWIDETVLVLRRAIEDDTN